MANVQPPPNPLIPPIKRWQTIGYPIFSEFIASDDELFILRRFKTLNARIILRMQDEICKLEADLKECDQAQMNAAAPIDNGSFRHDKIEKRTTLLDNIHTKLKEYNEFVVAHSELRSRPAAQQRQIRNILHWHAWNPKSIRADEAAYINAHEDLVTIVPCLKSPLQHILAHSKWFSTRSWMMRQPNPGTFSIVDEGRAKAVDTTLVLVIGLVMLIVPIWVLELVTKDAKARLGVISGFIALFLFGIQGVTAGKPGETLAATAAYSAVLMVFVQTTSS